MELNRDHYFMIGLVLLLMGAQFRYVESFQLNAEATRFLAEKLNQQPSLSTNPLAAMMPDSADPLAIKKTIRPPKWLGWALLSIGSVFALQSLGMRKPG